MADDWRERLRSLRDRFTHKSGDDTPTGSPRRTPGGEISVPPDRADTAPTAAVRAARETVAINLGIDFGTSFTKVCFRDVGTEETSVIPFEKPVLESALIPSIVAIDGGGRLCLGDQLPPSGAITMVPYLKMRLAGLHFGKDLGVIKGVDLTDSKAIRTLSSWFLASVLKRSQDWISCNERDRLKNRTPVWSGNVGVPVEYCDSDAIRIFEEVLGIAWLWVKSNLPETIGEAVQEYQRNVPLLREQTIDLHAVPEIAAAVHSFVISRESVPGIYVYFDIGSGTLDGVAFNLVDMWGERRINFYSGKVEPLGMSVLASELDISATDGYGPDLVERRLQDTPSSTTENFMQGIRQLVAYVIVTAKTKDGRDWQRPLYEREFIGSLDPSQMVPLDVFVGGGGSLSAWYRSAIESTYREFKHYNAGIPPYRLREVPKPADLFMRGLPDAEFRRFAISYGLSIPFGEAPEVKLPSQFGPAEGPKPWQPPGVVDYLDTKDVYD